MIQSRSLLTAPAQNLHAYFGIGEPGLRHWLARNRSLALSSALLHFRVQEDGTALYCRRHAS